MDNDINYKIIFNHLNYRFYTIFIYLIINYYNIIILFLYE